VVRRWRGSIANFGSASGPCRDVGDGDHVGAALTGKTSPLRGHLQPRCPLHRGSRPGAFGCVGGMEQGRCACARSRSISWVST